MSQAEFDGFADDYLALHKENIAVSGEEPDYFARYKLVELRRLWNRAGWREPQAILDFGSGIGASLPHLARAFPGARLTAFDVSERSLALARHRVGGDITYLHGDDETRFAPASFDLVFTSCVFHHIDEDLHVTLLERLRASLRAGGQLVVFEHNPINPVTRYIVATCPFDENAVLIQAATLRRRLRQAGFRAVQTRYTGFFPRALAMLRPIEPLLSAIPLGAQYYAIAHD